MFLYYGKIISVEIVVNLIETLHFCCGNFKQDGECFEMRHNNDISKFSLFFSY